MKKYKVKLTLTEPQLGTVPKDEEVYKTFIENKKPEEQQEEEFKTVEKAEERGWIGFHKDEEGLFLYDYMFRGFLKAAAQATKYETGLKAFKKKIDMYAFVFPRRLRFVDENTGDVIKEPDGDIERSIWVMTSQGPRVSLIRSDKINPGRIIQLELHILNDKELTKELLRTLFHYGAYSGLGQFRNGSYGRFGYEMTQM